jgi:hypothetical protein
VPAGTYGIRVSEHDLATVHLRVRALRPGEIWDVGTLRFQRGGTLVVTGASESMSLKVVELDGYSAAHIATGRATLRSERIPPGNYLLLVRGDGIAAHAMPVSIRDGEETTVEVSAKKGVRQQIVFAAGPGTKLEDWIQYRVDREGQIVARLGSDSDRNAVELGTTLWLAPGAYTLCTENREPPGTATFTVGDAEGPVVRVVLR